MIGKREVGMAYVGIYYISHVNETRDSHMSNVLKYG